MNYDAASNQRVQLTAFPVLACTSVEQLNYDHRIEASRAALHLDWIRAADSSRPSAQIGDQRVVAAVEQTKQWASNPFDAAIKVFEFHNPFRPAKEGVRPVGVPPAAVGDVQCAPSDEELRAMARTRMMQPQDQSVWAQFSGYIFGLVAPKPELAPPQRIPTGLISKLDPLPVSFPVWVKFPEFGTALATHYMCIEPRNAGGRSAMLFYYVVKLKPYGLVKGEPFSQGVWEVPAPYCMRMELAAAAVNQEEGLVLVYDDCGRSRTITWAEFRMKPGDAYDKARKALLLQYPDMLLAEFSTVPQLPPSAGPIVESTTLERTVQPMPADVFVENPTAPPPDIETEPEPAPAPVKSTKVRPALQAPPTGRVAQRPPAASAAAQIKHRR